MLKKSFKEFDPRSSSKRGQLPKFNQLFLVQRYICGKIFMMIRSVVLCEDANRQTDRQTDKRPVKHNLLGGAKISDVGRTYKFRRNFC